MAENDKTNPAPSRQDIMREIGAALAERRKVRGLTIEKVGTVLKIRVPYLKAMEKGEWGDLPGEVYAKGFIRRYAQFLGLDGDKLLTPYLAERPSNVERSDSPAPGGGTDISRGLLVGIGVIAVFIIVIFTLVTHEKSGDEAGSSDKAQTAAQAPVAPAPVAPVDAPVVAPAELHRIEVYSPYPLWLRVSADDRNFEGFIPQGSTWNWSAKGKFSVRLGHSRQVSMLFDGNPVLLRENQKRVDLPE
jgi:transcriptional regulator with XRE-family HTH domain